MILIDTLGFDSISYYHYLIGRHLTPQTAPQTLRSATTSTKTTTPHHTPKKKKRNPNGHKTTSTTPIPQTTRLPRPPPPTLLHQRNGTSTSTSTRSSLRITASPRNRAPNRDNCRQCRLPGTLLDCHRRRDGDTSAREAVFVRWTDCDWGGVYY